MTTHGNVAEPVVPAERRLLRVEDVARPAHGQPEHGLEARGRRRAALGAHRTGGPGTPDRPRGVPVRSRARAVGHGRSREPRTPGERWPDPMRWCARQRSRPMPRGSASCRPARMARRRPSGPGSATCGRVRRSRSSTAGMGRTPASASSAAPSRVASSCSSSRAARSPPDARGRSSSWPPRPASAELVERIRAGYQERTPAAASTCCYRVPTPRAEHEAGHASGHARGAGRRPRRSGQGAHRDPWRGRLHHRRAIRGRRPSERAGVDARARWLRDHRHDQRRGARCALRARADARRDATGGRGDATPQRGSRGTAR